MPYTMSMNSNATILQNKVSEAFAQGKLIALPTETVYGLAAPIDNENLVARIFDLKERPLFDPLIVHVKDMEAARELTLSWNDFAQKLAQAFWPGPLTMVLERNPERISDLITAGLDTVGIRFPSHPLAREILKGMDAPLAAPSANKFTKTSPTTIAHVQSHFSEDDVLFIDGGACEVGVESTIVRVMDDGISILRRGMITSDDIRKVLGDKVEIGFGVSAVEEAHQMIAPGMHYIHYRPEWPVVVGQRPLDELDKSLMGKFENYLFEERILDSNPLLAARALYGILQSPLKANCNALYVNIKNCDLNDERFLALWDRLQKALSLSLVQK